MVTSSQPSIGRVKKSLAPSSTPSPNKNATSTPDPKSIATDSPTTLPVSSFTLEPSIHKVKKTKAPSNTLNPRKIATSAPTAIPVSSSTSEPSIFTEPTSFPHHVYTSRPSKTEQSMAPSEAVNEPMATPDPASLAPFPTTFEPLPPLPTKEPSSGLHSSIPSVPSSVPSNANTTFQSESPTQVTELPITSVPTWIPVDEEQHPKESAVPSIDVITNPPTDSGTKRFPTLSPEIIVETLEPKSLPTGEPSVQTRKSAQPTFINGKNEPTKAPASAEGASVAPVILSAPTLPPGIVIRTHSPIVSPPTLPPGLAFDTKQPQPSSAQPSAHSKLPATMPAIVFKTDPPTALHPTLPPGIFFETLQPHSSPPTLPPGIAFNTASPILQAPTLPPGIIFETLPPQQSSTAEPTISPLDEVQHPEKSAIPTTLSTQESGPEEAPHAPPAVITDPPTGNILETKSPQSGKVPSGWPSFSNSPSDFVLSDEPSALPSPPIPSRRSSLQPTLVHAISPEPSAVPVPFETIPPQPKPAESPSLDPNYLFRPTASLEPSSMLVQMPSKSPDVVSPTVRPSGTFISTELPDMGTSFPSDSVVHTVRPHGVPTRDPTNLPMPSTEPTIARGPSEQSPTTGSPASDWPVPSEKMTSGEPSFLLDTSNPTDAASKEEDEPSVIRSNPPSSHWTNHPGLESSSPSPSLLSTGRPSAGLQTFYPSGDPTHVSRQNTQPSSTPDNSLEPTLDPSQKKEVEPTRVPTTPAPSTLQPAAPPVIAVTNMPSLMDSKPVFSPTEDPTKGASQSTQQPVPNSPWYDSQQPTRAATESLRPSAEYSSTNTPFSNEPTSMGSASHYPTATESPNFSSEPSSAQVPISLSSSLSPSLSTNDSLSPSEKTQPDFEGCHYAESPWCNSYALSRCQKRAWQAESGSRDCLFGEGWIGDGGGTNGADLFMGALSDQDIMDTLVTVLTELYESGQKSLEWMHSEQQQHELALNELYEALEIGSEGSD